MSDGMAGSAVRQRAAGRSRLRLIAAPFTAFAPDGSLALDPVDEQVAELGRLGVDGAFVCGTTGEGLSLSVAERMAVAERWLHAGADLEVIVHVGHNSVTDATELARHAAEHGASAIAAVPPFFHRPRTVDELADWCAELAAAAPQAAFFYYHIPHLTKVELPMAELIAVASERVESFGGVKFTDDDLFDYAACLDEAGDGYEVFFGRDEILLGALALGASAAVGSTYNFAAPLYRAVAAAQRDGDLGEARRLQGVSRRLVQVADGYGGLAALKALASTLGPELGPCRPPLRTLDEERRKLLVDDLEQVGFFDALDGCAGSTPRT